MVDPQSVVDRLPGSVLAFFYMNASSNAQKNRTLAAHALFHRDWPGLLMAGKVPLLIYKPLIFGSTSLSEERNVHKPFTLAPEYIAGL